MKYGNSHGGAKKPMSGKGHGAVKSKEIPSEKGKKGKMGVDYSCVNKGKNNSL